MSGSLPGLGGFGLSREIASDDLGAGMLNPSGAGTILSPCGELVSLYDPLAPTIRHDSAGYSPAIQGVSPKTVESESIQLKFAKMLLKMSSDCRKEVDKYKGEIEEIQRKQKEAAAMVSEARLRITWCGDDKKKIIGMGPEMIAYFSRYNLAKGTEGDPKHYTNCFVKDQWEFNLKSLTNHQEQIGTETQTKMVFLQDFVGQYQANLTGAKTAIADFNDLLKKLIH